MQRSRVTNWWEVRKQRAD